MSNSKAQDSNTPDFSELSPEGMIPSSQRLQARRSAETKLLILETAIDCLTELGYSGLTTQVIAHRAHLSRGAMLHHYATKQDLIAAVMDYAFYRHIENFSNAVRSLSDEERAGKNAGIAVDWETYNTREFLAYLELNSASRTDSDLHEMFIEKARRHDRYWRKELVANFPEWAKEPEKLDFARRLTQALMSGMVLQQDVWGEPETIQCLLSFITNLLLDVREGRLPIPKN